MASRSNTFPSSRSSRRQSNRRHDDGYPPVPMTAFAEAILVYLQGQIDLYSSQLSTKMDTVSSRLAALEHSVRDLDMEMHSDDDDNFIGTSFVKPAVEPARPGMIAVPATD